MYTGGVARNRSKRSFQFDEESERFIIHWYTCIPCPSDSHADSPTQGCVGREYIKFNCKCSLSSPFWFGDKYLLRHPGSVGGAWPAVLTFGPCATGCCIVAGLLSSMCRGWGGVWRHHNGHAFVTWIMNLLKRTSWYAYAYTRIDFF